MKKEIEIQAKPLLAWFAMFAAAVVWLIMLLTAINSVHEIATVFGWIGLALTAGAVFFYSADWLETYYKRRS